MKKIIFCLLLLVFACNSSFSQTRLPGASNQSESPGEAIDFSGNPDLKKDIEQTGLAVANKLLSCCSSWGGNNLHAEVEWDNVRISKNTGSFTIPMTVFWVGSMSGAQYWIKGRLVIDSNGGRQWLKISDSGGFSSGCSGGCIN